ncbi:MAG: hypothetical protein LIO85_07225, partial [Rikenellaceae bacterium]|nr:hypothetical protein [Rikenellaceae bacterium]
TTTATATTATPDVSAAASTHAAAGATSPILTESADATTVRTDPATTPAVSAATSANTGPASTTLTAAASTTLPSAAASTTLPSSAASPTRAAGAGWPCYTVGILGSGKQWADTAAATPLRALGVEFKMQITASTILDSWTWDLPVRYLPVQRDGFEPENPSSDLIAPVRVLSYEDYHPFLHLRSLLDRIFAEAGYRLRSDFMDGDFFRKLHISGNYPLRSSDAARSRMDFRAGRRAAAAATADSLGRVYANPYLSFSSVGNLVETADPAEAAQGSRAALFDIGGCFRPDGDRVAFIPQQAVTAAFEYRIHYTTGYYLARREKLSGFDSVNLDDGLGVRTFALANRFADRHDAFTGMMTYTLVVFGHKEGDTYRFAYLEGGSTLHVHSEFSARTATVTVNSSSAVSGPQLHILNPSGTFTEYDGDWALYDGYVQENGTLEVELRVRSVAERLLPSRPKYFDSIFFGGAPPGTEFILGGGTTVRPVFTEYPTLGTTVGFEDVAAHDFTCLDLIRSVRHLFNLRFYTDEVSRNVYAEPYPDFYRQEPVTDWSDRVDLSRPVLIREPAEKTASTVHYCYRSGDGAVTRRNRSLGETLGKWTVTVRNNLAPPGEQTHENGIFTASVNSSGDYPDAPDASLLQAGDRDSTSSDDMESLDFLPKIVVYEGLRELPAGQRWGWPSNSGSYPYLAFHHSADDDTGTGDVSPFTLCFEDRDGVGGLHRFRDRETAQLRSGKRVEVWLDLSPADVEPLLRPNSLLRDFRGLFRLRIGGETALYRLEEVVDYTPSPRRPTRCIFLKKHPLV